MSVKLKVFIENVAIFLFLFLHFKAQEWLSGNLILLTPIFLAFIFIFDKQVSKDKEMYEKLRKERFEKLEKNLLVKIYSICVILLSIVLLFKYLSGDFGHLNLASYILIVIVGVSLPIKWFIDYERIKNEKPNT